LHIHVRYTHATSHMYSAVGMVVPCRGGSRGWYRRPGHIAHRHRDMEIEAACLYFYFSDVAPPVCKDVCQTASYIKQRWHSTQQQPAHGHVHEQTPTFILENTHTLSGSARALAQSYCRSSAWRLATGPISSRIHAGCGAAHSSGHMPPCIHISTTRLGCGLIWASILNRSVRQPSANILTGDRASRTHTHDITHMHSHLQPLSYTTQLPERSPSIPVHSSPVSPLEEGES